jgi:hypothetical protein
MTGLGLSTNYCFTLREGILWSLYLLPSVFLVFAMTSLFKRKNIYPKSKAKYPQYPLLVALFNMAVVFVVYVLLFYFVPGFFSAYNVGYAVVSAGLVGISTFYYVSPPPWELLKPSDLNNEARCIEALKLEHNCMWSAISMLSWTAVIGVVSLAFAGWTQIIFPSIPAEKRFLLFSGPAGAQSVIEVTYLIFGLYFGVIGRFLDYSWQIRKKIAGG